MRVAALRRILGTKKMHSDFNAPLEWPVAGNPFSGRSPKVFLHVYRNRKNKQEPSRPTSRTNKKMAGCFDCFFREQSSVQYTFLAVGLWIHCCHEYVSYNIITRQYKSGV